MTDDVRTDRPMCACVRRWKGFEVQNRPDLSPVRYRSPIMDFVNLKTPDTVDLRLAWMPREALTQSV